MTNNVSVRRATPDDAATIAHVVAMAIGDEQVLYDYCGADHHSVLAAVAQADATQYSWRYALIAEVDGSVAGAIVGYDGAELETLRAGTFAIIREHIYRPRTYHSQRD